MNVLTCPLLISIFIVINSFLLRLLKGLTACCFFTGDLLQGPKSSPEGLWKPDLPLVEKVS